MREYEIIHENVDRDTGELMSFLLLWDDGSTPELKHASPRNVLLYKHELYNFLNGDDAVIISEENPRIVVASIEEYMYMLSIDGVVVEATEKYAEDVLVGINEAIRTGSFDKLQRVHKSIKSLQVRKKLVNTLKDTFDESSRIQIVDRGWLIDGFFIVDWEGKLYSRDDDGSGEIRQGNKTVETDKTYELVILRCGSSPEPVEVCIGGTNYTLSEQEMLFLSKVTWVLNRTNYHPNLPMWKYIDKKFGASPYE